MITAHRFNRKGRYGEVHRCFAVLMDEIDHQQRNDVLNPAAILSLLHKWQQEMISLLGKERFNKAKRLVRQPMPGQFSVRNVLEYAQPLNAEIGKIEREEDTFSLTDLARQGQKLGQGHQTVNGWKDLYDEWVEEIEDRLLNLLGDEKVAEEWSALVNPDVCGTPDTEQKDRERLHQAFKQRLAWLRRKINERNSAMNVNIGTILGGNNQIGMENQQTITTQTLQILEQLSREIENAKSPEEKKQIGGKLVEYLNKYKDLLGPGAHALGRLIKGLIS